MTNQTTKLKNFEDKLKNVQNLDERLDALDACYKNNIDSFDFNTTTCADLSGSTFKNAYETFILEAYEAEDAYTIFAQDIVDLSGGLHGAFARSSEIPDKHKAIKALRNELDNKMRELYNPELEDTHIMHDSNVYMTLAWTVLATSVLYYLFIKL